MALSDSARLYLTWQVFDAVNRRPLRFVHLEEEVSGLAAWPDFRHAVMADSRFLVSGDAVDIATAGIHPSSPVIDMITATLDRVRLPMRDRDLSRVVRRLRPNFPTDEDPVAMALNSSDLFRPRTGHVARRKWLQGARPLELPPDLKGEPVEVAAAYLEETGARVPAVALAAALAERFGLSMPVAYGIAVNEQFLALPDGTVCLYLPVEDEITSALDALAEPSAPTQPELWMPPEETVETESYSLPSDLVRRVMDLCNTERRPVTTEEVVTGILHIDPAASDYLLAFWAVQTQLGLSPELLAVGPYLWFLMAAVPGEAFRTVRKSLPKPEGPGIIARQGGGFTAPGRPAEGGEAGTITLTVSAQELAAGALTDARLGAVFPDHPFIQAITWHGHQAWYNAQTCTIVGLSVWMQAVGLAPGDSVTVRRTARGVEGSVRPGLRTSPPMPSAAIPAAPTKTRSLLLAITELLVKSGGSLPADQLLEMLQAEDPWIVWDEVRPILERTSTLGLAGDLCFLVTTAGRQMGGGAAQAETTLLLEALAERHPELRSNPQVLALIAQVVQYPRVTAEQEAVLVPLALAYLRGETNDSQAAEALVQLTTAHMRMVVRHLVDRSDLVEMLPHLDDYYQAGCMGLLMGIEKFDRTRARRLAQGLGWHIRGSVDRLKPRLQHPLRFPDHFWEQLEQVRRRWEDAVDENPNPLVMQWLHPEFLGSGEWEDAYEDGVIAVTPLTSSVFPDVAELVACSMVGEGVANLLDELLEGLTPRQEKVIRLRFGLDDGRSRTLEEVGLIFGLTRERIRQIEAKALLRLRHPSRIRRLRNAGAGE